MSDRLRWWGVIDKRGEDYSLRERLHLVRSLARWGANLYVFGQLAWERSIAPLSNDDAAVFREIAEECRRNGLVLWAWMKPGDARYASQPIDRETFVLNARRYLELGASGFYLLMDDLHREPGPRVRPEDAEEHAKLIEELAVALGDRFMAICGEHYHGAILSEHDDYWRRLTRPLPPHVMVTWTGPRIWNETLAARDVPQIGWPLLLWDNYFASDSPDPDRAPIYPYDGRDGNLRDSFDAVLVHPNVHYAWQYCALSTAMAFWREPASYDPREAFKASIRDLGDELVASLQRP